MEPRNSSGFLSSAFYTSLSWTLGLALIMT